MEKKEFAVGEEFQFGLKRLRCEKDTSKTPCNGCVFVVNECDEFINSFVGPCTSQVRTDKTDVIFVEVK